MKLITVILSGFVMFALAVLLGAVLFAMPIKWLWNYAAVDVLSVHRIDFWHAWALGTLCGLLFKSNTVSKSSEKY